MFSIKKVIKTASSVGYNPKFWLMELCRKIISNAQIQDDYYTVNPYLNDFLSGMVKCDLEELTVTLKTSHDNPEKISALLSEYGICIIEDFIDSDLALNAGNEFIAYINSPKFEKPRKSSKKQSGEEPHFLWQTDYAWTDNYLKAANFSKPIINIRSRQKDIDDAGMVDIFNIQKLVETEKLHFTEQCIEKMSNKKIVSLLSDFTGYKRRQFNLYYNNGVTQTRGPHIDNNSDPYKLFVYLSDVKNDSDGPYCYLPGSSKKRNWMSFERLKNIINQNPSTEVSSISREHLVKIFGKAGTAIITNQSGIHCGGIQSEDGERVLLVSNYY